MEVKAFNVPRKKGIMKNKEKPVNHPLSAPPELPNNESGGDRIITGEYCITDRLHTALSNGISALKVLKWPLLDVQISKYLSAANVSLVSGRFFCCFLCIVVLYFFNGTLKFLFTY